VLTRFGPRLPALVEAALMRQQYDTPPEDPTFRRWMALSAFLGACTATSVIALIVALN
jgi:ubiquinone biosynthesis protein